MPYELPKLKYSYSAFEPFLDTKTVEYHYNIYHRAYVDRLNKELESYPHLYNKDVEDLLTHLDELPEKIQDIVRNHGGGHFSHSLLWQTIDPNGTRSPKGNFAMELNEQLGGIEKFKKNVEEQALNFFGTGNVWLCVTPSDELVIKCLEDQDCPLTLCLKPLIVIDLWEHASFLKHQNRRADYLRDFWSVLNWESVEKLWEHYNTLRNKTSCLERKSA